MWCEGGSSGSARCIGGLVVLVLATAHKWRECVCLCITMRLPLGPKLPGFVWKVETNHRITIYVYGVRKLMNLHHICSQFYSGYRFFYWKFCFGINTRRSETLSIREKLEVLRQIWSWFCGTYISNFSIHLCTNRRGFMLGKLKMSSQLFSFLQNSSDLRPGSSFHPKIKCHKWKKILFFMFCNMRGSLTSSPLISGHRVYVYWTSPQCS